VGNVDSWNSVQRRRLVCCHLGCWQQLFTSTRAVHWAWRAQATNETVLVCLSVCLTDCLSVCVSTSVIVLHSLMILIVVWAVSLNVSMYRGLTWWPVVACWEHIHLAHRLCRPPVNYDAPDYLNVFIASVRHLWQNQTDKFRQCSVVESSPLTESDWQVQTMFCCWVVTFDRIRLTSSDNVLLLSR